MIKTKAIRISSNFAVALVSQSTLFIGSKGVVRTETLRAYTEDEYRKIIAALP